jgi:hypothetical protein
MAEPSENASMDRQTFAGQVNTEFRVSREGSDDVVLLLIQVESLSSPAGAPRADPFALTFVGPRSAFLEQATYDFRHATLGEMEIFIVPIGYADGGVVRYEAVFN